VLCAWALILGAGLAGSEFYARRAPDHMSELDKLKVYNRGPAEPRPRYFFKPGLRMARRGGRLVPAASGERPFWSSNSWGFRGAEFDVKKPSGTLRIVCLGASTTEGAQGDEETYPYYLQEALRSRYPRRTIEVINAGHHAQNMDDLHALLKLRVLPLEPDVVIVYEAANNVDFSEFMPSLGCKMWVGTNHCVESAYPGWLRPLRRRSSLFRIFEERFGLAPMPHPFDDKGPKPGLQRYGDALRRVVMDARRAGTRVILSSFIVAPHEGLEASIERDTPLWRDIHRHYYPLSMAELERVFDAYNARSRTVAAELKVPYADVAAEFPKEARYFPYDIMHLGPEGNKILAGIFARFLEKKVL
jgi:lysophospholipase L1-like esterase